MTLGLSLNTRIVGMAVLNDKMLVEYKVSFFKEGWSPQKRKRMLAAILLFAQASAVSRVACLSPLPHHQAPGTRKIIDDLQRACNAKGLPLYFYSPAELHHPFGLPGGKKRALLEALCLHYPELTLAGRRELRNQKRYYTKLFEAVAAATLLTTEPSTRH